jgi:hypothetical protein
VVKTASQARRALFQQALAVLVNSWAMWGCGQDISHAGPLTQLDGDAEQTYQAPSRTTVTPCEDWSTLECGVELRSHGGLVDCARGVRVCQAGRYGACMTDASLGVVSVEAPQLTLPESPHTGVMAVGGVAASCVDDPCNPLCQRYLDEPATPYEAPRVDTPTGNLYGGSLQSSNVPPAFKNKGSLNSQCSSAVGSQSYKEACQFDQHCVSGACAAFLPGESGSCTGVDITAPTTCVPAAGGTRALTVCNRGTQSAAAGIKCYGYAGGSPQFPNSNPGTTDALLMTTQNALGPGECETQQIDEAIFGPNGIQSVGCNPHEVTTTSATLLAYPSSSTTTTGKLPWLNATRGYASDGSDATVSPQDPNGASSGSLSPTADTTFAGDGAWNNPASAYTLDGSFASVAPSAPAGGAGPIGPRYPRGFTNPASSSDSSWSNPDRIYSADSSYLSAAPSNPTTTTTVSGVPSTNDGSATWSNRTQTAASDGSSATSTLNAAGTNDLVVGGFGFSLPPNAVIDEVDLSVRWHASVNSNKYSLSAQAMTGSGNTVVGSALTKSSTYTTDTTDSLAITSGLSGFTASDFSSTNFKVRLRFSRSNGSVTASTASVDWVSVSLKYHLSQTQASVVYQYFGLGSIPSSASVQLTAEVKWKSSAVNNNLVLGMQLYKNWGSTSQATLGSEVTRTPALANTDYVDTTAALTPSPADLIDTSFAVRLRATRLSGASNPDFVASVDYVRVNVTWSLNGASSTYSVYLRGFGLDQLVPSGATITSLTTSASWKLSAAGTAGTLGLQAYTAGGSTALGTETVDATSPTTLTTATQNVTGGLSPSDLSDANFGVRVRVSRAASTSAPAFTAFLDEVHVVVAWTSPSVEHGITYGNFGILAALPSTATVTGLKTEARWKNSASNHHAELAFQLFSGATALGAEYVDTNPSTSMTTLTQTLTGLSLAPSALSNPNFSVRVRSTRSSGSSNADYTSDLDFVRVTVTYADTEPVSVAECNDSNNWTATKLVPSPDVCQDMSIPQYVPFTVTRLFQGLCGPGQKPTWRRFGYTTQTPASTSVEFRLRSFPPASDGSCPTLAAVTSSPPNPLATASATKDPQVCSTTDPACVLDLYQYLGALPGAGYACLQMDAYGIPDSTSSPELIDWTVLYDCADAE